MSTTVFNINNTDHLKQHMFFGDEPNVQRFDVLTNRVFDDLTNRQWSFFWRPEEVDLTKDAIDFTKLSDLGKHIFTQNLLVQSLLDSVQGRGPNLVLLPIVSDVALENFISVWTAIEGGIHSRSYTHIIRNVYPDPTAVFDQVMVSEKILARAKSITKYYDELMAEIRVLENMKAQDISNDVVKLQTTKTKEALYLCMHTINALEAIRFYVSFVCNFSFPENGGLMEGSAKIMKLIAR